MPRLWYIFIGDAVAPLQLLSTQDLRAQWEEATRDNQVLFSLYADVKEGEEPRLIGSLRTSAINGVMQGNPVEGETNG